MEEGRIRIGHCSITLYVHCLVERERFILMILSLTRRMVLFVFLLMELRFYA